MRDSLQIEAAIETWPIAGEFSIARGSKREATVVVARVGDGTTSGRGECVPYARYGETVEGVRAAILAQVGIDDRSALVARMPAGAARNALDCALWDYQAKRLGESAAALAGVAVDAVTTAYTISLDDPPTMAAKAARAARRMPLLKIKLGGDGDAERMRRIRAACPDTRLVADANEAWTPETLPGLITVAAETGLELVEQPLPADQDGMLGEVPRQVPVCADESLHTRDDLQRLRNRYDAVNIKLDKAGGLTAALSLAEAARGLGFKIMVGCMVSTSLSIAPAVLVAQGADWVDLDGPLLLARDRSPPIRYEDARLYPAPPQLWG